MPREFGHQLVAQRRGFTLVELLVVIAVIGVLVALLLPAVQTAREAARRLECANNLKNIGIGLFAYHNAHNEFPCGGWGQAWVGVPERGVGPAQPGAWIYCLLPYVEETNLYSAGLGTSGSAATQAYSQRLETPIALFVCPSRRACRSWPIAEGYAFAKTPYPFGQVSAVARTDYAINAGTAHVIGVIGPNSFAQGDDPKFWRTGPQTPLFSGISHLRRATKIKSIVDGTSKTYLVGEKLISVSSYTDGTSPGDFVSLYAGFSVDSYRFAGNIEAMKVGLTPYSEPLADTAEVSNIPPGHFRFGSAHSSGVNMLYCDGAVQHVNYDVSPDIHFRAGHRADEGRPYLSLL